MIRYFEEVRLNMVYHELYCMLFFLVIGLKKLSLCYNQKLKNYCERLKIQSYTVKIRFMNEVSYIQATRMHNFAQSILVGI